MEKLIISPNEKVLIIAPHPDDESIGCGGLLLMYSSRCDVICISDGRQGQGDITPIKLKGIRRDEFRRAMETLSVNSYRMLGVEDGTLCGHLDALTSVDFTGYSKVFVTGRGDINPDHSAAIVMVKKALEEQKISGIEVYEYEVHKEIERPSHFLEIDEVFSKKDEMIRKYDSQVKNVPFEEITINRNLEHGNGKHYVEVYNKIALQNVDMNLSVETDLEKSRELYWILVRWMKLKNRGCHIADYFKKQFGEKIIIYGYKELGSLFEDEIESSDIELMYIVDSNERMKITHPEKNIISAEDLKQLGLYEIPIIVTATFSYDTILQDLGENGYKRIKSIKNVIEKMEYNCECGGEI